jgi:hypothetical protein
MPFTYMIYLHLLGQVDPRLEVPDIIDL